MNLPIATSFPRGGARDLPEGVGAGPDADAHDRDAPFRRVDADDPPESRATVLVVDDQPETLDILVEVLQPEYRVSVATSGRRAIEIASAHPLPDLILLDVVMPDMDGYGVLSALRSRPNTRDIPVIFVSAMDALGDEQRGLELGAADYLAKPLKIPLVLARVRTQLALKESRDRLRAQVASLEREVLRRTRAEEQANSMNEGLAQHARALELANKDLEAFAYTVSHDLRAPLRAINGFAQLLRESPDEALSANGRHLLDRIIGNARRMSQLIDDVLAYTRSGQTLLVRQSVALSCVVRSTLEELHGMNPRAQVQIDDLPIVMADKAMLRQVYANLLSNALKFTSKRANPLIQIGATEASHGTTFFVRDNGAGFDNTDADKLFGVFQRLHREADFPGTGIGLAIARRLVERHGGRIWAESAPDAGASFYFTLDPPPSGVQRGSPAAPPGAPSDDAEPDSSR